jgi:hypothetical protein
MSYLNFISRESFAIKTNLATQEIKQRLSQEIEPHNILRNPYSSKKSVKRYEGAFEGENFKIRKIYTNDEPTFGTIFMGKIQGSGIDVVSKLPRISEIFTSVCSLIFLLATAALVLDAIKTHEFTIVIVLFPIGSFLFYGIPRASLKYETKDEEAFLNDLLGKTKDETKQVT